MEESSPNLIDRIFDEEGIEGELCDRAAREQIAALNSGAHPVGSIYTSSVECNPAQMFGNEWKALGIYGIPAQYHFERTA